MARECQAGSPDGQRQAMAYQRRSHRAAKHYPPPSATLQPGTQHNREALAVHARQPPLPQALRRSRCNLGCMLSCLESGARRVQPYPINMRISMGLAGQ